MLHLLLYLTLFAALLTACGAPLAAREGADNPPAAQSASPAGDAPVATAAPAALVPEATTAPTEPPVPSDSAALMEPATPTLTVPSIFPTPWPPANCPITQPQDPPFVPPAPYAPEAPYGEFWYGTNELWTMLYPDGHWHGLPSNEHGYGQKVLWWREGYDMTTEQQPQITVSGRRLDGDAPTFEQTGGTNGYHADVGQFMLTGVAVPTAGCWEIIGHYRDATLTFVVWVSP
ncbi:hypothetical protein [Promineifilum sp.]|uniref:hypothetical protein n=1 Tax=Promineifilum sp. TaxID=2664178 RepID=UPI0035B2791D